MSLAGRLRMAAELRAVNPSRLATWDGWSMHGAVINPYGDFRRAHLRGEPRDVKLAELLIGDLVVDVLVDDELIIFFSNTSRREWFKPFSAEANRERAEASA